jgi:hypothetical protein
LNSFLFIGAKKRNEVENSGSAGGPPPKVARPCKDSTLDEYNATNYKVSGHSHPKTIYKYTSKRMDHMKNNFKE